MPKVVKKEDALSAKKFLKASCGDRRFMTQDGSGLIKCWENKPAPDYDMGVWVASGDEEPICLGHVHIVEFVGDDWDECLFELVPGPEKWIGHLCKFYNGRQGEYVMGILSEYKPDTPYPFTCRSCATNFPACEPVKRADVSFVGD